MALDSYANLKTEIAACMARSDLTSQIDTFIDLFEAWANRNLRTRQMENEAYTPAVEYLPLPTDFLQLRDIQYQANPRVQLQYVTPEYADAYDTSGASGTPKFYTLVGNQIRRVPAPDATTDSECHPGPDRRDLVFLLIDTGLEAFEVAADLPAGLQGEALVLFSALLAWLVLLLIGAARRPAAGVGRLPRALYVAGLIAIGIELHNLGEGMAIGDLFGIWCLGFGACPYFCALAELLVAGGDHTLSLLNSFQDLHVPFQPLTGFHFLALGDSVLDGIGEKLPFLTQKGTFRKDQGVGILARLEGYFCEEARFQSILEILGDGFHLHIPCRWIGRGAYELQGR